LNSKAIDLRLQDLLSRMPTWDEAELQELHHGAIGVMQAMYGENSSQERALAEALRIANSTLPSVVAINSSIAAVRGALTSMQREVGSGFLGSLRAASIGEVLTDFTA
jgi:hypothetical protein